jgi:mono/diheme cytochrome c family protein
MARGATGIRWIAALVLVGWLPPAAWSAAGGQDTEWSIPDDAVEIKSPVEATPAILRRGASIFESSCRPCHGPEGRGNGPLSDPARPAADLTAGTKADLPADGVLFYKVWNGRRPMPAFKSELTRDDVWAVVEHVKTLKKD